MAFLDNYECSPLTKVLEGYFILEMENEHIVYRKM